MTWKICEIIILYKDLCSRSSIIAMLSGKSILANLKIWCSKMQPFSGNQRPDPVTSLMNMSPVLNLPRKKKHLYRSSSKMFKTWTALWPKADFEVNMLKTFHARSTFGSWAVQKVPVAVARRTFEVKMRQNVLTKAIFCNCYTTLAFCSLLARCRIHCICHKAWRSNIEK